MNSISSALARRFGCPALLVGTLLPFTLPDALGQAEFFELADLDGGTVHSEAFAVSADGSTAVGHSISANGLEAVRWSLLPLGLGDLAGGGFQGTAWAVSGGGSVVVGGSYSASGLEAFRWDAATGMMAGLGDLPDGGALSEAYGVSDDGSVVVGRGSSINGREAFRWEGSTGQMTGLGDLAGGSFFSEAYGVSGNGQVVVGKSESANGSEAFRWEATTGQMAGLGDLDGGDFFSEALAASADGSVVVGRSKSRDTTSSSGGFEPFIWHAATNEMTGLGSFPLLQPSGVAHDVSADGSIVVGTSGSQAFIWDADNGMRKIRDLLVDEYGVSLNGWILSAARGISANGRTIAGLGFNPQGNRAAWLARLPDPAPSELFADGRLYVAAAPGVVVYEADGTLVTTLDNLPSPAQAGDVAFNYVRNALYITDRLGGEIHVIDSSGAVVQTFAPPTAPDQVIGIEIDDAGTAYVAGVDGMVHVFTNEGVFDRSIAIPGQPVLLFLALSPDQSKLLVTESNFFKGVHHFDLVNGDAYLGIYGETQADSGLVAQVTFASDGTLYITDDPPGPDDGTIEKYHPDGTFGGVLYTGVKAGWGLEVGPSGTIWLGNTNDFSGDPKLIELAPDGSLLGSFGSSAFLGQNAGMAFYTSRNEPPTAVAGADQAVRAGDLVQLDGTGSFDDNTATVNLEYTWSFESIPAGSAAVLDDAAAADPSFLADLEGTYVVSLVVTDEAGLVGEPSFVTISSDNLAPTAVATADPPVVLLGDPVQLDGSASSDPEGNALTYSWSIESAPPGSTATITNDGASLANLVPDLAGLYVIRLQVADFLGAGVAATVEVTVLSASGFAESLVREALLILVDLPRGSVTTTGNQKALSNFLRQVLVALDEGDLSEAISKLQKAIARTDGVIRRGAPDGNGPGRDWVTDGDAQQQIYTRLDAALQPLLEE